MLTIRIKSENGTLKCEFTEMDKLFSNEHFETSFQPIALYESAEKYLKKEYGDISELKEILTEIHLKFIQRHKP